MPLFIIPNTGFWKNCFSTEIKYEELEEQEGKYFSDFVNQKVQMQEHKNIGKFTENVIFFGLIFGNFFLLPLLSTWCSHE